MPFSSCSVGSITSEMLATSGVSKKRLSALSSDDKRDSTSLSRLSSFPHAATTNSERSSGLRRSAEPKISLTCCHFLSTIFFRHYQYLHLLAPYRPKRPVKESVHRRNEFFYRRRVRAVVQFELFRFRKQLQHRFHGSLTKKIFVKPSVKNILGLPYMRRKVDGVCVRLVRHEKTR